MTTRDRSCKWISCLASWLAMGGTITFCNSALAQVTPDGTLGVESSVVTPQTPGSPVDVISGGATRGANLFHSFEQFSVQTGRTALFNNAADIQNIISRVTGSSISSIDGLIQANGTANLFLLNPNGIIFGRNARLDIGGSFAASTANSIKFADGTDFSARIPHSPLLTVSVPIGLQFGSNAEKISVQGDSGFRSFLEGRGLRVPLTKTLALVGGNVTLEGAFMNAPGGRIELGSVAGDGMVNLNPTLQDWTLNYQGIQNGNIQLKRSFVDIAIQQDSSIQMPSEDSAINIRASRLDLENSIVRANTFTSAPGGDVNIDVEQLTMQEGATVATNTFNTGEGGDLTVNATEFLELIGRTFPATSLSASTEGAGKAGSLTITTPKLLVRNGAQVNTATFGAGNGGTLTVNAFDVQLIGTTADGQFTSALSTSTQPNSTGNAGDLTIKTNTLLVRDGAQVTTGTSSVGKGGNLTVDAFDVHLIGRSAERQFPSGLLASTTRNSTGNAGDLTIKTNTLLVKDGAGVSVQSLGTGTAGNMTVNAGSIRLDNNALLTANTQRNQGPSSDQATININSKILTMSRNSNIRTNARGENVIGGNSNIDTDFLVAFENSDISANSANFRGGNVRINASGIFGTQFRDVPSDRTSDITATGVSREFGGNVEITTPDVDPSRGLLQLPTNLVDAAQQIATGCNPGGRQRQGSFTVTGRGGLPPNPREAFNSDTVRVDWVTLNSDSDKRLSTATTHQSTPTTEPIVEATGWVMNDLGEVLLIASLPTATPHNSWDTATICSAPKSER